jgi:protoheme IX farnesyltransferase
LYGCCAAGLGAWFLAGAHRLRARVAAGDTRAEHQASNQAAIRLFHQSIAYLTLLFAAIAVAALLPIGRW